jgi:membrane protease YdiL (CAAX protease family)
MTARSSGIQARSIPVAPGGATAVVALAAFAASLAIAFLNQPYFDLVNGVIRAQGAEARGVLFSSWLLLIGVPVALWRPRACGLTLGSTREHWRLIVGTLAAGAAVTAGILLATGPIPFSDASWFIETVDVPITEELVFRGVLFAALLGAFGRLHPARTAVLLAVVVNGLAFGLAHVANAADLEVGFVLAQVTFASVLGMGCAALMARTGSLYPAILLHAVVNAVVVL